MTGRQSGASLLVETLASLGTTDLFTLCGNHVLPVADALRTRNVRVVAGRSEAAVVFAADAYARVARRPGVALVSGGPGLSNTLTAMLTARGNRSPVVVVSGEPDGSSVGRGAQQEIPHVALTTSAARWSRSVTRTDHIEEAVREAFQVASSGTPGPVSLSFPLDVLRSVAGRQSGTHASGTGEVLHGVVPAPFLEDVVAILSHASRPAVVAGAGVWQGRGEHGLARLVERTTIPVFTLDSARGAVPDDVGTCFGSADPGLNAPAQLLVEADVVVVAGRPIDFRLGLGEALSRDAVVVHVDTDLPTLGRNLASPRTCLADPAAFVTALAGALPERCGAEDWSQRLRAAREAERNEVTAHAAAGGPRLHPAGVARVLGQVGNDMGAVFAVDCGEFAQWCRQVIPAVHPGSWLRLGPQATCGAGLPFGLGAKVARPDRPVLVVAGDGGLGFHIAELETATREGAPVVVVVGHDDGWGIERNLQDGIYGPGASYATRLSRSSWTAIASGFGAAAVAVDDLEALSDAVAEALRGDETTLIEVPVQTVPSRVTQRMVQRERARMEVDDR